MSDVPLEPDWIAPGRTALLIVDMQVDFAAPEGVIGRMGVDISSVTPALAAAQRLAESARAAGVPVIFVGLSTSPDTDSPMWRERMARRGGDPDVESNLCRTGQPGSDFHGPGPAPGEQVISKTRYSAFFGTGLGDTLREQGIDTLVLCGLTTECCVDCTARDAFHQDFHVFVPADACAAYEVDVHEAALKVMALNFAIVTDTEAVVSGWSSRI
ncbi:MAG: isochorismatase [Caulobacter sp. 12-67-6]|nr:MAG: isochorismatase [Caulobacter sp. 12-67-6]OYX69071.1 MAG: isochorismatase [Caulobacter sp. 32-67-35]OYX95054.1 MAG: isochorismatase [Caulobacter sp. 35-67-4]